MLLIREATPADAALLVDMIRELADFEKELDQVEVTPEDMVREGFTGSPGFHALIAEWDARPVGYAVYFFTFSTWTGRQSLFVEDLFVREEFRRKGIGRAMLRHLAAIAQALAFLKLVEKSDSLARQIGDELKATLGQLAAPVGTVSVAHVVFRCLHGSSLRACG